MSLSTYLQELDEFISAAPEIQHVEVLRRSVWDTGMECIAVYRYKLRMSDGSLLELTERLVETQGSVSMTKYRYHWQDQHSRLIKRWDNAPHHRNMKTFPHHVHEGSETNVLSHVEIHGLDVLKLVIAQISRVEYH